ncbi:MAG: flagellar hook protein [Myxococcales bacterium]|nr:MAG: flagellar hook protein [Myxococcales bacterium]
MSTQMISGLASSLDWRSMIDQLIELDRRPLNLITQKKTDAANRKKAWQDINSKLASVKSAIETLRKASTFTVYQSSLSSSSSTAADDLLSVSLGSSSGSGTFEIEIQQLAQAEKLSSNNFSSKTQALGLSGEFLLGGRRINVEATDSLNALADKINLANMGTTPSGVSASVQTTAAGSYRLVLTAAATGAAGISIQDASASDIVQSLGFTSSGASIKNATSSGAESDAFTSSTTSVQTLLGLSSAPSGTTVQIGAHTDIEIDLSQSLTQIKDSINTQAGTAIASIEEESVDGATQYRLKLVGTTYVDDGNVLEALGVLAGAHASVAQVVKGEAMTKTSGAGGGVVTAATTFAQINTGSDANNVVNLDTIAISGKDHDGNTVSGSFTITDKATTTVGDLLTEIENVFDAQGFAVTATVDGSGKITVTDDTTGMSQLTVSLVTNNEGGGTLDFGAFAADTEGRARQIQAGGDARIEIDGTLIERSSNSIDDVLSGVTLNLKKAEVGAIVTATLTRDADTIAASVDSFVSAYNAAVTAINKQSEYDQETKTTGGPLFGDSTLSSVRNQLLTLVIGAVSGAPSSLNTLRSVGLELSDSGGLTFDKTTFNSLVETDFDNLLSFFTVRGSSANSQLSYASSTRDTLAGSYAVNITSAAAQATVTGATDLSGGLAGNMTLTLTDALTGQAAVVSTLTAGMTADDVAAAINSELNQSYTQTLTEATGHSTVSGQGGGAITSATTWEQINTGGDANDLTNGDVISFSGTNRFGASVGGYFTISNKATDTVGGLLEAIETAYDDEVNATVDDQGRIVLTDKQLGTSNITLSLSYDGEGSLSFDTVNTTTTGRYAMDITAGTDGAGHLTLTHNEYGSNYGFTIAQSVNHLGIVDQAYAGEDVEGTIDGVAAAGSGRILSVSSAEADTNGLSISYAGTATGAIGSLDLSLGFSEMVERMLYSYTDSYSGYISARITGIDSSMESFDSRIELMEMRLDAKRERMVTQFVRMEKLMSTLQSQSSWLSAQTGSL